MVMEDKSNFPVKSCCCQHTKSDLSVFASVPRDETKQRDLSSVSFEHLPALPPSFVALFILPFA